MGPKDMDGSGGGKKPKTHDTPEGYRCTCVPQEQSCRSSCAIAAHATSSTLLLSKHQHSEQKSHNLGTDVTDAVASASLGADAGAGAGAGASAGARAGARAGA